MLHASFKVDFAEIPSIAEIPTFGFSENFFARQWKLSKIGLVKEGCLNPTEMGTTQYYSESENSNYIRNMLVVIQYFSSYIVNLACDQLCFLFKCCYCFNATNELLTVHQTLNKTKITSAACYASVDTSSSVSLNHMEMLLLGFKKLWSKDKENLHKNRSCKIKVFKSHTSGNVKKI